MGKVSKKMHNMTETARQGLHGTAYIALALCAAALGCFLTGRAQGAENTLPKNGIYTYLTTEEGLRLADCYYRPVYEEGHITLIRDCGYDNVDLEGVGKRFAPELDRFCLAEDATGKAALIYDGGILYAYDGVRLEVLKEYGSDRASYGDVAARIERDGVILNELDPTYIG